MFGSLGYMIIKDGFDNEPKLPHIASPTLIIHGKKDKMVLPDQSAKMYGKIAMTRIS